MVTLFVRLLFGRLPDLWPIERKIGEAVTPALRNVYANFGYFTLFSFRAKSLYGTYRQTDGPMDGRARPVVRPMTEERRDLILFDLWIVCESAINAVISSSSNSMKATSSLQTTTRSTLNYRPLAIQTHVSTLNCVTLAPLSRRHATTCMWTWRHLTNCMWMPDSNVETA